jgi:hypothetical protein
MPDIVNQLGYTASAVGKARHRSEKLIRADKEFKAFIEFVVLSRMSPGISRGAKTVTGNLDFHPLAFSVILRLADFLLGIPRIALSEEHDR